MFLNKVNNKLYPDYRDKKLHWGLYEIPEEFKGYELIDREKAGPYLTREQLDLLNKKPMDGYLGFKWYLTLQKRYEWFYNEDCTELKGEMKNDNKRDN